MGIDNAFLLSSNPWWKKNFSENDLPEKNFARRFVFTQAERILETTNLMLFIKGMRRLGKSTLIKQLIASLLFEKKIAPQKIMLVEFSQSFNDLSQVLQNVPKNSYLFLDEIQFCGSWRDILKLFYDTHQDVKIVFTGSAGISFSREKESLLGRFLKIDLAPMLFPEYLHLKFHGSSNLLINQTEWFEFMNFGEFPELIKLENYEDKFNYLRDSIIDPMLTTDISFYQIEKKTEFHKLLKAIVVNVGQVFNKHNLGQEIGLSRPALDRYLNVMADIGLIEFVGNYYKSTRTTINSDKKIYFRSINLVLTMLGLQFSENLGFPEFKGHIFENAIYNSLRSTSREIFYWKRRQKEIDFLAIDKNAVLHTWEVKMAKNVFQSEIDMYGNRAKTLGAKSFNLIYQGKTDLKNHLVNFLEFINNNKREF